jgi:hypothetical protein
MNIEEKQNRMVEISDNITKFLEDCFTLEDAFLMLGFLEGWVFNIKYKMVREADRKL